MLSCTVFLGKPSKIMHLKTYSMPYIRLECRTFLVAPRDASVQKCPTENHRCGSLFLITNYGNDVIYFTQTLLYFCSMCPIDVNILSDFLSKSTLCSLCDFRAISNCWNLPYSYSRSMALFMYFTQLLSSSLKNFVDEMPCGEHHLCFLFLLSM